jgi:hypothetical protein
MAAPQQGEWRPPRKGVPTVVIVLVVVGGIVAVLGAVGIVVAVKLVRFTREAVASPIGQETNRAMEAPGARELLMFGCNPGYVIDVATMPELTELYRKDPRRGAQPVDVPLIVDCGPGLGTPRTCDEIKIELLRVAAPKTSFRVFVHGYDEKVLCNERYAASGERL